uniref:DUF4378 domain-containing protein n=1 Tax=Rhizophora mucronata TaxID=61149 RepID=A0A2P2P1A4_RHIMU
MRRASPLHESLDRYARLFEYSSTQEAKWHQYQSKSLRLTSEDKFPSGGRRMKSFTRRLSLSDLDSICPLPNEILLDTANPFLPVRSAEDCHTNAESNSLQDMKLIRIPVDMKQTEALDIIEEAEHHYAVVERGNNSEDNEQSGCLVTSIDEETSTSHGLHDHTIEQVPHPGQEISSETLFKKDGQSLLIASEICYQDNMTGQTELPILQSTELGCGAIEDHVSDPSVNLGTAKTMVDGHFIGFGSNNQDDPEFSYVRDVLDISGFIEQGHIGTWDSLDQPLSRMLFKELEAHLHPELQLTEEDVNCNCNHRLLFDLVNELLLEIYGGSFAYFPKSFSLAQRACSLPKGNRIVEQVWKGISWYRNSSPETMDQSLDDIVGRDFEKGDAWMSLALDFEDVALELEDLIFDQLLDEAVCF